MPIFADAMEAAAQQQRRMGRSRRRIAHDTMIAYLIITRTKYFFHEALNNNIFFLPKFRLANFSLISICLASAIAGGFDFTIPFL